MDVEKSFEHGTLTLGAVGKIAADCSRQADAITELRAAVDTLNAQLTAALVRVDELEEAVDDHDEELFGENKLQAEQD